ncbi:MAG: DUF3494 domain-containing protein [Saprospirales bacterium]|nr:DUF3494 domain-containing protein [Saprospirales bacterium]
MSFAQIQPPPPDLGDATNFALFTSGGAFINDGATVVTGDIGTHVGAFSGFPPGIVIGAVHLADVVTAAAEPDVESAYMYLDNIAGGSVIGTTLGGGQLLTPDVYILGAASTLDGALTLDGQGNPDAIFIFQIDGALSTTVNSTVTLINSASLCNVYWQVNGAVDLGENSVFRGTILAAGAISLLEGADLYGRGLTTAGQIDLHNNIVTRSIDPVASVISASGAITFCIGGSVTLSGNVGGVWSTGATTVSITVSASGDYFVTNTTECGSINSNHIIVTVNPLPACSISGATTICQGQTTQLCATPGMLYMWSTGAITDCITVSTAGSYSVTVTDGNGCSSVCSATVTVNPLPACTISGATTICEGQVTQLCAPAGASGYLWSTGAITNCIIVSTAGSYSVTVTGANGCTSICSATVTVNPLPVCTISGNTTICQGQTTQLCTPAGASGYLWSTGAITNCITVSTAGAYSVTVTGANGCSSICSATVTVNPLPVCTISGNTTICEGQITQLCVPAGASSYLWSTGAITNCIIVSTAGTYSVTVTGANGCVSVCNATVIVNPLPVCTISGNGSVCPGQTTQLCVPAGAASYLWSTGAITNCITVGAGTYLVTVTSASGCISVCTKTVTENPTPTCTITGNNILCQGQTTQLCVPAGASSYLWSTGATTNCITVSAAGNYSVTVTEANGCISTCSQMVTLSPLPVCTITGNESICPGQTTQLCAPAGAASYLWSTGATTNCITVGAGTYLVTVTNSSGCFSVCTKTVTENPMPNCTISGNGLVCQGQTTQLCVPAGAVSYLWSNGAITNCITVSAGGTYSVTVTEVGGCVSTCSKLVTVIPLPNCNITGNGAICEGQSTQLCATEGSSGYLWSTGATTSCITVSAAGTYFVTITGVNGCISICSKLVTVGPSPVCTITGPESLCPGQSAQLCAPAGAFTYQWSNLASTSCITINAPGTYSVTVTYANGCVSMCSITVASAVSCVITGGEGGICEDETTILCAPTGSGYTYLWSNGAITSCITVGTPGTYSVTVTNASGCSSTCSKVVIQLPEPNRCIDGSKTICEGYTSVLCSCNGPGHTYLWSTGATTKCITVGAGTYSLTVTNTAGCVAYCEKTVTVVPPPNCAITGNSTICPGGSTSLCAPVGSGNTYLWSTGATTRCITVNAAGTYSVTVTNNGCQNSCSKTVTVTPLPPCTITGNPNICQGSSTTLCAPSGSGFTYKWSNTKKTRCITISNAGTYSVTVTSNGCTSACSVTTTVYPKPVCYITGDLFPDEGESTTLCAPPGMSAYLWSTGATTQCVTVDQHGTYWVTITNSPGCTSKCSARVEYEDGGREGSGQESEQLGDGDFAVRAYPNPFRSKAFIEFQNLKSNAHVEIEFYDLEGNKIATLFDGDVERGALYKAEINAESLPPGVYIYRIISGEQIMNRRIILIK